MPEILAHYERPELTQTLMKNGIETIRHIYLHQYKFNYQGFHQNTFVDFIVACEERLPGHKEQMLRYLYHHLDKEHYTAAHMGIINCSELSDEVKERYDLHFTKHLK